MMFVLDRIQLEAWGTGYAPGTAIVLENSQCKVYVADTWTSISGTDLTIWWNIELKPTMGGRTLNAYMFVNDTALAETGYVLKRTFSVP